MLLRQSPRPSPVPSITYILQILLYRVECLTEKLCFRSFHRRCIRSICHVTLRDRIRITDLFYKLSLHSIDTYVCRWVRLAGTIKTSTRGTPIFLRCDPHTPCVRHTSIPLAGKVYFLSLKTPFKLGSHWALTSGNWR